MATGETTPAIATPSDGLLVARAKAGDFDAFEELVTRHEGRIYAVATNILRQRQDAEDAVQTTFLSALEHLQEFREDASFATWIARIAVNTALKALRKRKGLSTVTLEAAEAEQGEIRHPELIAEWRGDPAKIVAQKDLRRILDEAIAELPEGHRLVFVLRDVEGFSVRETAETLAISEANVKVRLLRADSLSGERLTRVFGKEGDRLQPDHAADAGELSTPAEALLRSYQTR